MGVEYPIAVDNDFAVWRAFANQAWPALYFVDAQGRIRHHHFGEEDYERSERVIQQLLAEAGAEGVDEDLVSPEPSGVELAADWDTLQSPETYVGYPRATGSPLPVAWTPTAAGSTWTHLSSDLNQWSLSGDWTVGEQIATLNEPGGRITCRFHARDVNLVLGARRTERSARFRCCSTASRRRCAQGIDVDERGNGTVAEARLYQLIRQDGPIADRTFEITFLDPGARPTCSRSARDPGAEK